MILERRNGRPGRQSAFWRLRFFSIVLLFPGVLLGSPSMVVSADRPLAEGQSEMQAPGPRSVFSAIEKAWVEGDEVALADLVQVDGIRVTLDGNSERSTEYSPNQSLYFFKNLFRTRITLEFIFTRLQDVKAGERAHGMATWLYRTPGASQENELRLVFLLTRQDDVWRLSEINKISVR